MDVQLTSTVDPEWVAMVCEWVDLFRTDHCGYWLRGIAREPELGCLAWEDDEQHDFGQEPHREEALAAWKEGRPLPEGYYRLDAEFACRSWAEGVKLAGEQWFAEGDADRYDWVVQQALFGCGPSATGLATDSTATAPRTPSPPRSRTASWSWPGSRG